MYEVRVLSRFSSAHNLRNYKGKCENLHGHTWKVELCLTGDKLNSDGFLCDFVELKKELNTLLDRYDHKYINEVKPFDTLNPTAENLARVIYDELKQKFSGLLEVTVWESDDARAVYKA
jgi:6-pyruvoyltetrahydropterin/6-carboxytetrahydropterin synthase